MRVLHVIDSLGMGGAETWIMSLLRHWRRTGAVELELLMTSGRARIFDEEARALGARLHYARYGRDHLPAFVRAFRALLRDRCYDAIHDHADYASGWHFLWGAGLLPRVRVSHLHNPFIHIEANYAVGLRRRLITQAGHRLVTELATHVCATSKEAIDRYGFATARSRGPAVSVLHCGIEPERFCGEREADRASVLAELGWPSTTRLVLFAGRLDRALEVGHPQNHKNSWLALQVARAARALDPEVRLIMAGAGEQPRRELEERIRSWREEDALRLLGVREDLPRLMKAADCLLFPSVQEGLGMVAVEAQAGGLPVLASTAVPRECVLVPELYRAEALAAPISSWAEALLAQLATPRADPARARLALERSAFAIETSARALEAIYGLSPSRS